MLQYKIILEFHVIYMKFAFMANVNYFCSKVQKMIVGQLYSIGGSTSCSSHIIFDCGAKHIPLSSQGPFNFHCSAVAPFSFWPDKYNNIAILQLLQSWWYSQITKHFGLLKSIKLQGRIGLSLSVILTSLFLFMKINFDSKDATLILTMQNFKLQSQTRFSHIKTSLDGAKNKILWTTFFN